MSPAVIVLSGVIVFELVIIGMLWRAWRVTDTFLSEAHHELDEIRGLIDKECHADFRA